MEIRKYIDILESEYVQGKKAALLTLLQLLKKKAKEKDSDISISFDAFSELMSNTGYGIDYQEFEVLAKEDDGINQLVKSFDNDELIIGDEENENLLPDDDEDFAFDSDEDDLSFDDNEGDFSMSQPDQSSAPTAQGGGWDNQFQPDMGYNTVKQMAKRATNKRMR